MARTLAGYTDHISACPGETIAFKVSAEDGSSSYRASLVRLHSECLTGDILGSLKCDCGPQLNAALEAMAGEAAMEPSQLP